VIQSQNKDVRKQEVIDIRKIVFTSKSVYKTSKLVIWQLLNAQSI